MESFSCDSCGKRYKWKPEIAGRKVRCTCGATLQVPQAQVLAYQPPVKVSSTDSIDLVPDIYVPVGLMIAGVIAFIAWGVLETKWTTRGLTFVTITVAVGWLIKIALLSFVAWKMAKNSGGNFGNPLATILKIAALIVVLDALFFWLHTAMQAMGAISSHGKGPSGTLWLELLVFLLIGIITARYIFRLGDEEAEFFGKSIVYGNIILNILLLIVLVAGVNMLKTSQARANAVAAARAVPPTSAPLTSALGLADMQINRLIARGEPFIYEGRDWKTAVLHTSQDRRIIDLLARLYDIGAPRVYIDMMPEPSNGSLDHRTAKAYIELPSDPGKIAACLDAVKTYRLIAKLPAIPMTVPPGSKFLAVDLKQ